MPAKDTLCLYSKPLADKSRQGRAKSDLVGRLATKPKSSNKWECPKHVWSSFELDNAMQQKYPTLIWYAISHIQTSPRTTIWTAWKLQRPWGRNDAALGVLLAYWAQRVCAHLQWTVPLVFNLWMSTSMYVIYYWVLWVSDQESGLCQSTLNILW